MLRIDTHHHLIPPDYRNVLRTSGAEGVGRALPEWSAESALETMAELGIGTAILSVSAPGSTVFPQAADAAALARDMNDFTADLVAQRPDRFGFFATVPMPHVDESTAEAVRALDELHADGVVLLANSTGTYLGQEGQDELFAALDARSAVAFVHPAELPGPVVPGMPPFVADFLLDTTRAAYLLVRNLIRSRYPNIRFILANAGGFVPYAAHRLAISILGDTRRNPLDSLEEFSSFFFDTSLSSSPAGLPNLLSFANPSHITFGSDIPFAPLAASKYFTEGVDSYPGLDDDSRDGINRLNALALFPRLATQLESTSSPIGSAMRGIAPAER
jgi:predicted TIM-barrel fold metal-dependent hydrolase